MRIFGMLFSVVGRAKPAFAQGYGGGQGPPAWAGVIAWSSVDQRPPLLDRALMFLLANAPFRSVDSDIEHLFFDEPAIQKRLDAMAAQITADYRERELTVIAVLTGSLMFMSDLLRRIPLPLKLDCLSVVSYHGQAQTSGEVIFKHAGLLDVAGRD